MILNELLFSNDAWNIILVVVVTEFYHDDVIKCKQFPCYWPFVRGNHWSPEVLNPLIKLIKPGSVLILTVAILCLHKSPVLTLNVRGQSYLGLTRSISRLLMPWLLTSPGHQQPWYWLCRVGRFLSYFRKDFKYLRRINVEKWHKM